MIYRRNVVYFLILLSIIGGFRRAFFFHIAYVFAALLLLSLLFSWLSVNWVRIGRRTYVKRLQVGDHFDEIFMVRNTSIVPKLWIEIQDHSTLPHHHSSHVVPTLRGRQNYRWRVQTPCTRRGQFTLGPVTLSSGDPFGFFQSARHINATHQVMVFPPTVPIYEFATPLGALSGGHAVRRRTYEVTPNAAGIREYAPGDSLNRIHWKSSARRGKLMAKEFELDPLGDVWIFLDLSRHSLVAEHSYWGGADYVLSPSLRLPPSTEEYGIVAAASLAQHFLDQNRTVGFLTYSPHRDYIAPDRGDRQFIDILETLALARSETEVTLQQMLALEGHNLMRGTTLIVVSASLQTNWVAEAYAQTQRGLTVIAVVIDPSSFGLMGVDFELVQRQIESAGVLVYPVRREDDLTAALSYRPGPMAR
ncbi:MAG: DUF58 domain-containing protein [Chloroflexi bacterium]|nr:DUF58 domain-containing protein [Chloroflexota bacterium]